MLKTDIYPCGMLLNKKWEMVQFAEYVSDELGLWSLLAASWAHNKPTDSDKEMLLSPWFGTWYKEYSALTSTSDPFCFFLFVALQSSELTQKFCFE